jgi:hypothetical protein
LPGVYVRSCLVTSVSNLSGFMSTFLLVGPERWLCSCDLPTRQGRISPAMPIDPSWRRAHAAHPPYPGNSSQRTLVPPSGSGSTLALPMPPVAAGGRCNPNPRPGGPVGPVAPVAPGGPCAISGLTTAPSTQMATPSSMRAMKIQKMGAKMSRWADGDADEHAIAQEMNPPKPPLAMKRPTSTTSPRNFCVISRRMSPS